MAPSYVRSLDLKTVLNLSFWWVSSFHHPHQRNKFLFCRKYFRRLLPTWALRNTLNIQCMGPMQMGLCQHYDLPCCLVMRINKVRHNFGTSLRRHTQPLTCPIIQSSPTRTRVLYRQWKILSLWGEGSFLASIANRTWWRNAVVEMVKDRCPLCGCSISSLVASQLPSFLPQEKITRIRCSPLTATTSLTSLKKCNSQLQGVLRAILFACMAKVHLLV